MQVVERGGKAILKDAPGATEAADHDLFMELHKSLGEIVGRSGRALGARTVAWATRVNADGEIEVFVRRVRGADTDAVRGRVVADLVRDLPNDPRAKVAVTASQGRQALRLTAAGRTG